VENGPVTEPADRDALGGHDQTSFAGRPGTNMPAYRKKNVGTMSILLRL
jgi:hypothetical protein